MKTSTPRVLKYLFLIISFIFISPNESIAQEDTTSVWNIVTVDGNEFNGTILSRDTKEIRLETSNLGIITIQVVNIKKITRVEQNNIREGSVWMPNPQESRYFWGPSGYGLRKGESYYQNVWLFFNQIAFGVTDNFSIGFGMIPGIMFGISETPMWVTPKFSLPSRNENFSLGGGGLFGTVVGDDDGPSAGIVYGTATMGTRDQNISIGLGYGYSGNDWSDIPTVNISAMVRTGRRGYFITENYLIDGGDNVVGILSFGGRRIWSGGASLDYGGFVPIGVFNGFAILPWLGVVIPFGNKNINGL